MQLQNGYEERRGLVDRAIARAIHASPLFAGTRFDESAVRTETFRKGRLLDDMRGSCACVGLVIEGTIDVYSVAADGFEVKLAELGIGDSFGICNLCSERALPTVLRCRTACRVMLMPKVRFMAMMESDAQLALRYARVCNEKIAFLIGRIEELAQATSAMKLETYLCDHADGNGIVRIEGTRDDLARYLGISRSALFRQIARLKEEGVVCSHGRALRLCRAPCPPRSNETH